MVLQRPFEPAALTGKVPVRPATSTVFVQVLIAFVVFPSVCFRISFRKYAAEAQSSASEIHEMRDAWNPHVSVPPRTPDGTMSFELLIAACNSMVKSRLPLVRAYSQANATDIAVSCSTNTGKACR